LLTHAGFTAIESQQVTPASWVASSIIVRFFFRPGRPTRQLRNPLLLTVLMFSA